MAHCRVCLKVIKDAPKYEYYHDACMRQFFGSVRYAPKIDMAATQFQQQARLTRGKGLSISGVQAKLAASIVEGKIKLSTGSGDFIVKPCPELYAQLPANEHLSMTLARELGFNTAECALVPFEDGELAYITKRYDRLPDSRKLHQEDFMQAKGLPNKSQEDKYTGSYEGVAKSIAEITGNLVQPAEFVSRLMFMYLTGNGDFHQKNISLLYPDLKTKILAPIYDAVNTNLYGDVHFLALDFLEDDEDPKEFTKNGFYNFADFVELGNRVGIPEKHLAVISKRFQQKLDTLLGLIQVSELSDEYKKSYSETITGRMKALTPK